MEEAGNRRSAVGDRRSAGARDGRVGPDVGIEVNFRPYQRQRPRKGKRTSRRLIPTKKSGGSAKTHPSYCPAGGVLAPEDSVRYVRPERPLNESCSLLSSACHGRRWDGNDHHGADQFRRGFHSSFQDSHRPTANRRYQSAGVKNRSSARGNWFAFVAGRNEIG